MRIDAHHHVWALERGDYHWLTPEQGPLYRDFAPEDIRPLLDAARVDATIVVQATPTEAETRHLLDCAGRHDWIAGVVGWSDLAAADATDRVLALAREPAAVGIRPMLQDMQERDWIACAGLKPVLSAIAAADLVFDALIRVDQINSMARVADEHPDLAIVIDHAAKPAIGRDLSGWTASIRDLAQRPNVHVKFSGLLTEAPVGADAYALYPVSDTLLTEFGPDRMLWGSDWPVLTVASDYLRWLAISETLLSALTADQSAAVFGGNAASLYGISA
jgi:L-fuconolactonase